MLDFIKLGCKKNNKDGTKTYYPKFIIRDSKDLMIRGGAFYAIWNEKTNLWSTEKEVALYLIDETTKELVNEKYQDGYPEGVFIEYMWDAENGLINRWNRYCEDQMWDNYHPLDEKLTFVNSDVNKTDYSSKKLNYALVNGDYSAYEELISTLYIPEERKKIEWAIGAIVCGDSVKLQKFIVMYGSAGTGKSTILNIIQDLFDGYYSVFDAKALGSANSVFALEAFKTNPLVAIQHDGDLSRIEDNTRLNSVVSHELMTVNEKFKSTYSSRFNSFLFMGTNRPVKITDAKSGILRRLIDVSPSGNKIKPKRYKELINKIKFELGPIAYHCAEVYKNEPDAYDNYVPVSMMGASNDFYNYVLDSYETFYREEFITLKTAWELYKTYCDEARVQYPYTMRNFKEELKNYFKDFEERSVKSDGTRVRNVYKGFLHQKFDYTSEELEKNEQETEIESEKNPGWLIFENIPSLLDKELEDCPAQLTNEDGNPKNKWANCRTKMSDIDSSRLHYVRVPINHIVIDFDIPDESGNKCFERNLKAAQEWPKTYAELSKSGQGIHLHYIYEGDPEKLSRVYDDHIEIKVYSGNSSLRRKVTKCNDIPIASIGAKLPLKEEVKKMVNFDSIKSEKGLRTLIKRNLNKEIHPGTKPSIDFIYKILNDAYESGLKYDVTDLRPAVLVFATNSSHQATYCIGLVNQMKWKSEEPAVDTGFDDTKTVIIFYDVEVFPNLFIVNWMRRGSDTVIRMINPTPAEIEELMKYELVGFNCRRYDNHILYARLMGYSNEALYDLSQRIINGSPNSMFGEAFKISYTDIYDFAAKKQSLKKWEIELGIHHHELGLPWDQPVPEERWQEVAEYCDDDVRATAALFEHLQGDFTARKILAELAGMTVNDTTNQLTTRIIFGHEKNPNLVYTDLATGERTDGGKNKYINAFPGYEFSYDHTIKKYVNMYMNTDLGFGGYVYAEPGMYYDVALLDVASLHPHSIIAMNCFGDYTERFNDILHARMYIKHGEFDKARTMLDGKLAPYLDDESVAGDLAQALKIAINSVYGLTSASFDNPFRDKRNKNNIVALRGALFMRTLQAEVESRGFTVAHVKTDSIKIPNATNGIIKFCMDFAKDYGYTFEHEATYEKMCLVNDAVYVAKYATVEQCESLYGAEYVNASKENCGKNKKKAGKWDATGTQFKIPYVFKTLFSKEPITFEDLCEAKSVTTSLYLDMNEKLKDVTSLENLKEYRRKKNKGSKLTNRELMAIESFSMLSDEALDAKIAEGHDYKFIGKVGNFCPIREGCGGGLLVREKDGKYYSATGAKGYRWLESEYVKELGKEKDIDKRYYIELVDEAVSTINRYGDFDEFASERLSVD